MSCYEAFSDAIPTDRCPIHQGSLSDRAQQVVGGFLKSLGSKIAASYQGAASGLEQSSLLYLAAILMVIGLVTNLVAQVIVRRFDPLRGAR